MKKRVTTTKDSRPSAARRRRAAPAREYLIGSLSELSKLLDVPISTLDFWRRAGLPGEPNAWDLAAVAKWLVSRLKPREAKRSTREEFRRARLKYERARADREVLRLRDERGLFLDKGEQNRYVLSMCQIFKERLLGMADSLPFQLAGQDESLIRATLRAFVRGLLADLSRDEVSNGGRNEEAKTETEEPDPAPAPEVVEPEPVAAVP